MSKSHPRVRARIGREKYVSHVDTGTHAFIGDEPEDNGGKDLGPSPPQLLLSGLATCTVATLRMYADRKEWPMEGASLDLWLHTEKTDEGHLSLIHAQLELEGPLTEVQRERLLEIAKRCPVHRILTGDVQVRTQLKALES